MLLNALLLLAAASAAAAAPPEWPGFRGKAALGLSKTPAPLKWDVVAGQNVLWKTRIPGLGHSSPVVAGDLVCVTTALSGRPDASLRVGLYGDIKPVEDDSAHEWKVYCLDGKTGAVRFQQTAAKGVPKVKRHTKSTHASATMAADEQHLVAMFGSEGLYAFDHKGKLLWKKDLGILDAGFFRVPDAQWGFASSPVIHEGTLLIQADVQKDSFLAAFDVKTGRELWRTPRADVPTWSTPTVHVGGGRAQVLVNGFKHIGGYDLATGKELWRMKGGGDIPVPTPITGHGLMFFTNAHGGAAPVFAVKETASGDISLAEGQTSNEHVAWSVARDGAYMQTPLLYDGQLYVCRDNGLLSVYDAKTGNRLYQQRLGDGSTGFSASAVAADGKLYYSSEEGDIHVVKAGPQFELLGTNKMGEVTMATPAIVNGVMFFRTRDHVVAIGGRGAPR
jgi:outer membrane protein assembly factor BamB